MTQSKHTATPWRESNNDENGLIVGPRGENIAEIFYSPDRPFIVRAVNSHELLLEACEEANRQLETMIQWAEAGDLPNALAIQMKRESFEKTKKALKQAEEA